MEKKERVAKVNIVVVSLCVICCVSIVYATIIRKLNIDGYASLNVDGKWNIHFADLKPAVLTGKAKETRPPSIDNGLTIMSGFDVDFYEPGDSVRYEFNVTNDGSLDAEISSLVVSKPKCTGSGNTAVEDAKMVCDNLSYTFTYDNNSKVAIGDELNSGASRKMYVTLKYFGKDLPTRTVEISNLGITAIYSQK